MGINLIKKRLKNAITLSGAVLALAIAIPALAQYRDNGPSYDNRNYNQNYMGQGYYGGPGQSGWGAYDRNHRWRGARWWHKHNIQWFYATHPQWAQMDSSWMDEDGDYDNNNNWHDAYWWHQNDPDFFYSNHPTWASWDPNWRDQDGAYDDQHNWHYGEWWYNQNPN